MANRSFIGGQMEAKMIRFSPTRTRLTIGCAVAALVSLSACDARDPAAADGTQLAVTALPPLPDALPMTMDAGPVAYAPAAARLPAGRRLSYADPGDDGYAWLDRADTVFDVIGDAPPDYEFDYYDDVEPWGWEAAGGHVTYAEPIDDGYYRYYYYEPGADYPYLVRDPWNSYGYSGDRIVAVYDAGGALLPLALANQRVDYGSRYYARGADLRRAAARERRGVAAPIWAAQAPAIARAQQQWAAARDTQPAWRQWRQRGEAQAARAQVREERQARRAAGQRFATWQQAGLRGGAPALYPRAERQVARQAERQAQRRVEREQSVYERARADLAASQQRRRETMQVRDVPQGGDRAAIRAERQAERAQQRDARLAARADQAGAQQRLAVRDAQRQQRQAEAQRQQRGAEAQRQQRGAAERDQRQAAREQQRAQRQQASARQQQMTAAREQQRAQRQQQVVQREQAPARQQQMAAAREQQRAQRQQQANERRQQAEQRQQSAARQQQASAAREQQRAQRQQMQAQREQQVAARQQQAAARQQQQQARQTEMAQRQQQAAARQQQAAQQQQARQAEMAARQQQRAAQQAQRTAGGGGNGGAGGGERRGRQRD